MGKYEPLTRLLRQTSKDELSTSFREIEDVLGFKLPASAREHRPWWANSRTGGHSQAKGWIGAGWETRDIDLRRERVRFVRARRTERSDQGDIVVDLWEKAQALTGINDRDQLETAAVRALIQQVAAQQLARLGGSMPDADSAPRERRRA
ncbi:MAG: hypothetical protein RLZZ58_1466 [Pseudomonadota bacterium]